MQTVKLENTSMHASAIAFILVMVVGGGVGTNPNYPNLILDRSAVYFPSRRDYRVKQCTHS